MPVELNKENQERIIHVSELKDGQIAEIVKWNCDKYTGIIVQRFKGSLITIGLESGTHFPFVPDSSYKKCKVRVLKNGETLTIRDNE